MTQPFRGSVSVNQINYLSKQTNCRSKNDWLYVTKPLNYSYLRRSQTSSQTHSPMFPSLSRPSASQSRRREWGCDNGFPGPAVAVALDRRNCSSLVDYVWILVYATEPIQAISSSNLTSAKEHVCTVPERRDELQKSWTEQLTSLSLLTLLTKEKSKGLRSVRVGTGQWMRRGRGENEDKGSNRICPWQNKRQ